MDIAGTNQRIKCKLRNPTKSWLLIYFQINSINPASYAGFFIATFSVLLSIYFFMHRFLYCLFFLSIVSSAQQREPKIKSKLQESDTLVVNSGKKDSLKVFVPTINDYHFFTQNSEKKFFDTLLTANKSYAFSQYTNKDIFGKIQFANIGSGYNTLSYSWNNFDAFSLIPTNKSYGIIQADQIKYYDVKTPTTTFVFHNGVSNGAALYSTYTQNIGKRFNFAVEYFGLRSLGGYQNALAVSNNTCVSAHFISKRAQYELFAHYIHQNIINQENGGDYSFV
jgi:hypothetical protein